MTKIGIYTLLILALSGCSSFKGKEEGTQIDSFGNTIKSGEEILPVEQIYQNAKSSLKKEAYDVAIEGYREIEANYPFSKFAEQSHIELAYAHYKIKKWDAAIAIIDRFISMNSTSTLLPYAYYLRGLTNFNRGKTFFNYVLPHVHVDKDPVNIRSSYEDFKYVFTNYKDSEYVKDSMKRMVYLRNTLASYELHVSNYYFNRKAYIAVINRCNYIIEKYPGAPANIDALFFLKKSYELLMMTDSSRIIDKIIQKNFPDYESIYFSNTLDNKVRKNAIALSEFADDIAIKMGFDIENQSIDNFNGIYNVEYFTNENLVEIPRNIKPESYSIKHTINNKKISIINDEEEFNILNYFFEEDKTDLMVKDIIVREDAQRNNKIDEQKNNKDDLIIEDNEEIEIISSEEEIIQLLE
tara:strand:- start:194 stop:1426 length:1233 start_codon:yes stop_codon:yes gene_type:complete